MYSLSILSFDCSFNPPVLGESQKTIASLFKSINNLSNNSSINADIIAVLPAPVMAFKVMLLGILSGLFSIFLIKVSIAFERPIVLFPTASQNSIFSSEYIALF